jgi:ABC-type dipeptide/oligopeptide/nickel transport system permease subunit
MRRRGVTGSLFVLALLAAYVFVWPEVSPYGPNDVDFSIARQGPSLDHPLGTDQFGRDHLTRIADGGRNTFAIAGLALLAIISVGFLYGAGAALGSDRANTALMRVLDGLFALPRLPIAIVILVALRFQAANVFALALALAALGWLLTARLVHGHVLALRTREFVKAARAAGAGHGQIMRRHIFPNSKGILIVAALIELPILVVGEAFLAIFGLGPAPPEATWGNIARDGWRFSSTWDMTVATAAIMTLVVPATIVANAVTDSLDPRRGN